MFTTLLGLLSATGCWVMLGHLANTGVFPQPLSAQEEARLLKQLAAGDSGARNQLVERNLRLVAHIVKKFDNTGEDTDDLISIGTIGLIKAINTFDLSKNARLATYAARCIENEILMHLRAQKKLRGEVMLYDPIGADREGNEVTLLDVLGTDADEVAAQVELGVEQERLHRLIGHLTRRERQVIAMRYGLWGGLRRTQREISRVLGISRSYVSRIEIGATTRKHGDTRRAGNRGASWRPRVAA